jgi:hypothetical protein
MWKHRDWIPFWVQLEFELSYNSKNINSSKGNVDKSIFIKFLQLMKWNDVF